MKHKDLIKICSSRDFHQQRTQKIPSSQLLLEETDKPSLLCCKATASPALYFHPVYEKKVLFGSFIPSLAFHVYKMMLTVLKWSVAILLDSHFHKLNEQLKKKNVYIIHNGWKKHILSQCLGYILKKSL